MSLRLAFMGTPDFATPALAELVGQGHDIACVYTRPRRPPSVGPCTPAGPWPGTRRPPGSWERARE